MSPVVGIWIEALAGKKKGFKSRQVVLLYEFAFRVFLLDGAEGRRRSEEHLDPMLGYHPPECAGIGRADRLSLVEDRGAAVEERSVDDVGVAHDPSHVRGSPVHVSRLYTVYMSHAPSQRHCMAAVIANNALRLPRGARRV